MALDMTQLASVTNDYWENKTNDLFFRENILFYRLMGNGGMELNMVKANEIVDGGKKIRVFLEYQDSNSGTYGNTTTITAAKKDIINAARFDWAGYFGSNTIDLDEQVQNDGKAAMVDLVFAKMKSIEKTIRNTMGAAVFATGSGDAMTGLGNLFNTTTSTAYGSIAEDDMSVWSANSSALGAAVSFKALQALFRDAAVGQTSATRPNLVVTTETLRDGYERTLQVQQRFSDAKLVEAGFQNILHSGAPVVADSNQTAGVIDALNLNFLKIKTHGKYAFTAPKWEANHLSPDTLTANTRWIGNLVCSNRQAHARYTGATDPA